METHEPFGARQERPRHWVLLAGLLTTALTLFAVHWLDANTDDFHIMGWYANYVLPVGALIVGLAAGSGYGIASWSSGVKIGRSLLWIIVGLQAAGYFGAQYVEFRAMGLEFQDGTPVGFFEYLDIAARSFAWQGKNGTEGEPLGIWGYAFRLLELAGFVGGGLVVPAALRSQPYCEGCQVYLRGKEIVLLPAGVLPRKVKKKDVEGQAAYEREREEAAKQGQALLDEMAEHATSGRAAELTRLVETHAQQKKEYGKLERRIGLRLYHCRGCRTGILDAQLSEGHGNQIRVTPISRWNVAPGFVTDYLRA